LTSSIPLIKTHKFRKTATKRTTKPNTANKAYYTREGF